MKEFIEWAMERFGEPAGVLSSQRPALDKILQHERGAKTPADVLKDVMQVIGDKGHEQARKSFGSYFGVANGGLDILEFFFAVRAMSDWQTRLNAPSTKLNEAESALMEELAEGKEDLTVPPDATIKTCPLLKKTMAKLSLRGDEGIARAKMIIGRAAQVREQQQAFAKTQAAIAAKRSDADYQKLLADGAFAEAMKMLQKAGATGDEPRNAAKADLKAVYLGIESDEDLEALTMMIPSDVLSEAEAAEWAKERAQAQKTAKKAGKPAEEKPAKQKPAPKKKTAKKTAVPADPALAQAAAPVEQAPVEEKPTEPTANAPIASSEPPQTMPEEIPAKVEPASAEETQPAESAPVDDVIAQLMSARKRVLLRTSKKDLRGLAVKLGIEIPAEILTATGDEVAKAKEWLAEEIVKKEYATPAPASSVDQPA